MSLAGALRAAYEPNLWPAPDATTKAASRASKYADLVSRFFMYISLGEGYTAPLIWGYGRPAVPHPFGYGKPQTDVTGEAGKSSLCQRQHGRAAAVGTLERDPALRP